LKIYTASRCQCQSAMFRFTRQFYSKRLVQNNLPKVMKSCTVLKQFTVVAVLRNLPPGLFMEIFIILYESRKFNQMTRPSVCSTQQHEVLTL
jgi:hypothetical protein